VNGGSVVLSLPSDSQPTYDAVVRDAADTDDARLLKFYAALALNHISHLTEAIDGFLLTVEHNQPPKIFLGKHYNRMVSLMLGTKRYITPTRAICMFTL